MKIDRAVLSVLYSTVQYGTVRYGTDLWAVVFLTDVFHLSSCSSLLTSE